MRFFIVDLIGDYKAFADYDDVKDLLLEKVIEDTKMNLSDEHIVSTNLETLGKLARDKHTSINYITERLESFSYKIIDLMQLERDLQDLKYFIGQESLFDAVISLIDKGEK